MRVSSQGVVFVINYIKIQFRQKESERSERGVQLEQEGKSDDVSFVMMAAEFKSRRVIYRISCCLKLTNIQSMRFQSLPSCRLQDPSSFFPTHPIPYPRYFRMLDAFSVYIHKFYPHSIYGIISSLIPVSRNKPPALSQ